MAAVGGVFQARPRASSKLTSRLDADGNEVEVETREDEEQQLKLQETIELLLAAGYFRARIKGLSPFDKVVGGMVWCIETCNFDIDVDLLFQENLTIGQKISLTEKIVAVLPKMKCPHQLEPHQIQGLDFIHIFPVIRWLVKKAIETRQETGDLIRAFSISQFNKNMKTPLDVQYDETKSINIQTIDSVNNTYDPWRRYRRQGALNLKDEFTRVHSTLLEYGRYEVNLCLNFGNYNLISMILKGYGLISSHSAETGSLDSAAKETLEDEATTEQQKHIKALMSGMSAMQEKENKLSASTVGNIVGLQSEQIQQIASEYATKQAELAAEVDKVEKVGGTQSHKRMMVSLNKKFAQKSKALDEVSEKHREMKQQVIDGQKKLKEIEEFSTKIENEMKKFDSVATEENEGVLSKLRNLVSMNENLKQQEQEFKLHCREELTRLQNNIKELNSSTNDNSEDSERQQLIDKQYQADKEKMNKIRLLLAKKNREIAILQRKIDEVPTRAELSQYQQRFIELYNQVAAKYKETKQFYTLYNTLDDTKLYYNKEVNLLNSIHENFTEATSSPGKMEQFLKQFENIVEGIKQNCIKVEKTKQTEKMKRDDLNDRYLDLIEKQRLYFKTVKDFKQECHKNEILMSKIKSQGQ
ncbi:Coiled-coil domain-containing protein 93 [Nymphon striatum]|nr:Coiled-coil domain-containing protein 93 [Nymphon striatum]